MRIIEGDYNGETAKVSKYMFQDPTIEIKTGVFRSKKFKVPQDFKTLKLLNKDEKRTVMQLLVLLILAITIIGLLLAIPLFVIWRDVSFTIGIETNDGTKFVAQGDSAEWKILQKFIGVGAIDTF